MLRLLLALGAAEGARACCWCDEATPKEAQITVGLDKKGYDLVFSDEFDHPHRDFQNGKDTKWTALKIGDTSNKGSAYYLPEQATIGIDKNVTGKPVSALLITTENRSFTGESPTGEQGVHMPFRSAMLQTWNKFCFTGGIVEFRARQPAGGGYWPALWLFGNLGRAVYQNSNTGLWPWSYDQCDEDLQLPPYDPPQRISACDFHDLEKEGLHAFQGRGATELDVLEGAISNTGSSSYVVGSLQLSPGIPPYFRPAMFDFPTKTGPGSWYTGLTFGSGGNMYTDGIANNGWYGPPWGSECPTGCPDALSGGLVELSDLDSRYWTYRMEWITGPNGHLSWHYDGVFIWGMSASSFGAYSVCSDRAGAKECARTPPRQIPEEPMSLVMNTAIGTWNGGQSALDGKHWPAKFYVDYVRVWQREKNIGCDPPDYPTRAYINKNAAFYGEPVEPLGYDTCPEVYPKSAVENAKRIAARAADKQRLMASAHATTAAPASSGRLAYGQALASNVLARLNPARATTGVGATGATAAPAESSGRGWYAAAGAVLFLGGFAAFYAVDRVRASLAAAGPNRYEPAELNYEEFRRA